MKKIVKNRDLKKVLVTLPRNWQQLEQTIGGDDENLTTSNTANMFKKLLEKEKNTIGYMKGTAILCENKQDKNRNGEVITNVTKAENILVYWK